MLKLHYFSISPPHLNLPNNFGDELNPWLFQNLLKDCLTEPVSDDILFVGIGTLLSEKIPNSKITAVFGSGTDAHAYPHITPGWKFYCVRGPLTAKKLGLAPSLIVSDSAYLLTKLFKAKAYPKKYPVSFIPHYSTSTLTKKAFEHFVHLSNFHVIDPMGPVEKVLGEIASSELVIAQAMHGAIAADALRVPWIPVASESTELYEPISKFKWRDWCSSINLLYEPLTLPGFVSYHSDESAFETACQQFLEHVRQIRPCLSSDAVFERIVEKLDNRLDNFKDDFLSRRLTVNAMRESASVRCQQLYKASQATLVHQSAENILALNEANEINDHWIHAQMPVKPTNNSYKLKRFINKARRKTSQKWDVMKVLLKQSAQR